MNALAGYAVRVVGLDADDTLWENEAYFSATAGAFAKLISEVAPDTDPTAALASTEADNIEAFGYGVKSFTLSMVETAARLAGPALLPELIEKVIDLGRELLAHPVELLPGVAETVPVLAERFSLIVITKGDLHHQTHKYLRSGLTEHFDSIRVVNEKDQASYSAVLTDLNINPGEFVMVGNSARSDVLPPLELGARAIHIPHTLTWSHEEIDPDHPAQFPVLSSITDLIEFLP